MTAAERLLDRVAAMGVTLHADSGRLRFRAPRGVMTPDLVSEIRALEADLLAHLGVSASSSIPRLPDAASYEVSHAQRRLWVLHALDPDTAAYHIPLVHQLDGALNVDAMRLAFDDLERRHEALRTTFVLEEGVPRQRIAAAAGSLLAVADTSAAADADAAAMAAVRRLIEEPFDLERGPLVRASLIRVARERHLLCVVLHHLIADGVSIAVLMDDLTAAYAAACEGRRSEPPDRAVQYRDCAAWQNRYLETADADAHRRYWLDRLAGPIARVDLPADARRPAIALAGGAEETFTVDAATAASLRRVCREGGATLFMGLVALVKVLLHRYTGLADIIVGTPAAGRDHVDAERVVGVFINTLVLRDTLTAEMTFEDVLASVRRTSTEALDHALYPFDRLVQDLDTDRDPSRSPVFDVMVILQNQQTDSLSLQGLAVSPLYEHTGTSKFDLTFNFHESQGGISIGIEYRTALFHRARVLRMGAHLLTLMRDLVARPRAPIGALNVLPADERRRVLHDWNATGRVFPLDRTVIDCIDEQVREHPDTIAVVCGTTALTYAEIGRRSSRIAAHLQRLGAGPGSIVGLCLDRSTSMMAALLGVLRCGAAYCPLDPLYPVDRLAVQLRDSGARLLVSERALADRLPAGAHSVVLVESCEADAGDVTVPSRATPDGLAYVIYTSGSTGAPKGVQITHRNLTNLLLSMAEAPGIRREDVWLAVTSLSFDIAGLELYLPLMTGARLVIATPAETQDGGLLLERLMACRASVMQGTPATWRLLIAAGWQGSRSFKALCGGELLPDHLAGDLLDHAGEVWNLYGPTETTIWSLCHRVDRAGVAYPHAGVPIGRPIANTTAYILDGLAAPAPQGYVGDLYLGGEGVARGYLNRPELTADRFVPDPFGGHDGRLYRTGDRAVALEDGTLQFLGRDDHQVKVRGFRVELGEIEEALVRSDLVADAVVVASGEGDAERTLVAFVVLGPGAAFDAGAIRSHLGRSLPPQAMPSLITRLDRLPLTPNGKVDRQALPRPDRQSATVAAVVPPRDDRERQIRDVWASVLELDDMSIHDNFFELGGHSLRATRATYLLQGALGIDVTLVDIFKAPTVAELADRLRERQSAGTSAISRGAATPATAAIASTRTGPMTPEEEQLLGEL